MKNPFSHKTPTIPTDPHQITAENAYLYSPDAGQPRAGRFKQFWAGRTKAQQVLLIVGTVTIVFSSLMIGLSFTMMNGTGKKSAQSSVATSQSATNSSTTGNTDSSDSTDENTTADQTDTTASSEDVSWWQSLLSKVTGKSSSDSESDSSNSSDSGSSSQPASQTAYQDTGDSEEYYDDDESSIYSEEIPNTDTTPDEPTSIPTMPTSADGQTYTIASWNVYGGNKQNIGSKSKTILKSAQILGLQEVHSTTKMNQIKSIACSSCNYEVYMPRAGDSYPIVWQKSLFKKVDQGSSYMSSPPGLSTRYAVWVKLQNKKNGKYFYVVNSHLPPGVEAGGNATNGKNTSAYKTHMKNLVSLLKGKKNAGAPIFVTGDFNVNYRKDCKVSFFPCKALANGIDIVSGWAATNPRLNGISSHQGTHSNSRLIDYVMLWERNNVTANTSSIIGDGDGGWGGSDHKPSLLNVTVK